MSGWVARVEPGTARLRHSHLHLHAFRLPCSRMEVEISHDHPHDHTDRTAILARSSHPLRHLPHRHTAEQAAELEEGYRCAVATMTLLNMTLLAPP